MYLQDEFLIAIPLMLYVCLRFRSLIGKRIIKNISTVLFLLIAVGYPVAENLSHGPGNGWRDLVSFAGYHCLPLLLYLIMAVILSDLIVGFLRLFRITSKETVWSPRFKKWRLFLVTAVPVILVAMGVLNHNTLRIKRYHIDVPRRESPAEGITIVFMADLHLRESTSDRFLNKLVDKVNSCRPDIILVGGDILEGDRRGEDLARYEHLFRQMRSELGLYAVPGNHERYGRVSDSFFQRAGVRLLRDEILRIGDAFALIGRSDSRTRNRKPLDELLEDKPPDLPRILLVHRPLDFDQAVQNGVDVQLSGHTHHGQIFPINLLTSREYELSWGYLQKGQTHFFVTSGVQGWGPPVRTAGRSEILLIQIHFKTSH